jgi:hypothetical protein
MACKGALHKRSSRRRITLQFVSKSCSPSACECTAQYLRYNRRLLAAGIEYGRVWFRAGGRKNLQPERRWFELLNIRAVIQRGETRDKSDPKLFTGI